jgi:hypothetical protein
MGEIMNCGPENNQQGYFRGFRMTALKSFKGGRLPMADLHL